jgi:hypothetical protein
MRMITMLLSMLVMAALATPASAAPQPAGAVDPGQPGPYRTQAGE